MKRTVLVAALVLAAQPARAVWEKPPTAATVRYLQCKVAKRVLFELTWQKLGFSSLYQGAYPSPSYLTAAYAARLSELPTLEETAKLKMQQACTPD